MAIQQDNTLSSLGSILGSIPGLAEAIGGKTTTTSNSGISSAGLSALLNQLLSSTQGLASVAGGQNTAGLYNSTVQTQMVNDLLTRTAGEVAAKGPTTTTQSVAPTINLGQTLLQGAAGLIGSKILNKGVGALGDTLSNALGLGEGAAGTNISTALGVPQFMMPGATSATESAAMGAVPSAFAQTGAVGGAGVDATMGGLGTTISNASGITSSTAGLSGAAGGALDAGLAGAIGAGTSGAVASATAGGLAAAGSTLGGLGGSIAGDVAASTADIAAAEGVGEGALMAGNAALGPAGAFMAGAEALMEPVIDAVSWVVCTELAAQGEMNHALYQKAAPDFISRTRLKPSAVRGYHYLFVPFTRVMRRKDWIGRLAVRLVKPLAIGRASYIAGRWNLCGWFTFAVCEPVCSFIGRYFVKKDPDWQSLYKENK